MNLVSIRLITADIRGLVAFYERALDRSANWSNDDFAEVAVGRCRDRLSHHRGHGAEG